MSWLYPAVGVGGAVLPGMVERGGIHRMVASQPELFGDVRSASVNPDDIADSAWMMFTERDRSEATFSAEG